MSRAVDLDAIKAEATGEPIDVTVGGRPWRVLGEIPWECAVNFDDRNFEACFGAMVADPEEAAAFAAAVMAGKPSFKRLLKLYRAITSVEPGEAPAS